MELAEQILQEAAAIRAELAEVKSMIRFQLSNKDMLTVAEAAMYAGLKRKSIHNLTSEKKIPYSKPNGKNIFIKRTDLEQWMQSHPVISRDEMECQAADLIERHNRRRRTA